MTIAESYLLDVGQGTSNVILLGDRRAIVIDCGRSAKVPLTILRRYVDRIVALVVSHNDIDHHGGASQILAAYPKAIDRLYFLQDRPVEQMSLYALAKHDFEIGNLVAPPVRLERDDHTRVIYSDPVTDLSLELIFPTFMDNLEAQAAGRPNATSAVLVLFCRSPRIIFPGDATIADWRLIRKRLGADIPADVIAVPHHGGKLSDPQGKGESQASYESRVRDDLRWLYTEAVRVSHAVVSVGTSNDYGHPRQEVISALRFAGMFVLCTQITGQCHDNLELLRPGVIRPTVPSRSRPTRELTHSGNSRNVGCAGTVIVEISPDGVIIQRMQEHQNAVDRLHASSGGHALCRR